MPNPTLIHVAQVLAGRCPRRLLQGSFADPGLWRKEEKSQGQGTGQDQAKAHHGEVDRLLALYRNLGYWAKARVNVAFLETPLFLTAELDLVVADGRRAVVVEVKTGELRIEHFFQALLASAAWARLEGRVGLRRQVSAVLWHPGLGWAIDLKVPNPELLTARAQEALEALLAGRPRVGPECKGCPLAREGSCPEGVAHLGGGA